MEQFVKIVLTDPAVDTVGWVCRRRLATNQGRFFVMLKPLEQRSPARLAISGNRART
jgi:hypothetical protein